MSFFKVKKTSKYLTKNALKNKKKQCVVKLIALRHTAYRLLKEIQL